jgi:CxxC-x17-CxxC domain-containing protein
VVNVNEKLKNFKTSELLNELAQRDEYNKKLYAAAVAKCGETPMDEEVKYEKVPAAPDKREGWPIVCSGCGVNTTVPFEPTPGWKVYCLDCHNQRKRGGC